MSPAYLGVGYASSSESTLKKWVGDAVYRDAEIKYVDSLEGIGEKSARKLARVGIFTVSDIEESDIDNIEEMTNLSKHQIKERVQRALED